jgi:formylglycine-generating enzyme required for sulfatase activity
MQKPITLIIFLSFFACLMGADFYDEQRKLMPPANMQLMRVSANSVQLCWNEVPNRSDNPFIVHRKTGEGAFAIVDVTYTNYFIDTDISPNTQYQWRVSVKGYWVYSDSSEVVTLSGNEQNWAPSDLQVEAIAINQINLRWQDNSYIETGFIIERKSGASDFLEIATLEANTIAYTDSGFAQNTPNSYRLRAVADDIYSAYSQAQTCEVDSVSWAAKEFRYTLTRDVFKHKLALDFTWQNKSLIAKYFILERKINDGGFYPIATICANGVAAEDRTKPVTGLPWIDLLSTQYYDQWDGMEDYALDNFYLTDMDVKPNTVYRYRIRAMADGSYSSYSEEIVWQLKPTDWAPGEIHISAESARSVFLTWDWGITGEVFYLYCMENGGDYILVDSVRTNAYIHRGLDPTKLYTYYVEAKAAEHFSTPSQISRWRFDPESWKPHGLIAEPWDRNAIWLRWNDYCNFEEGIEIERKGPLENYRVVKRTKQSEESFIDKDLSYGLNYYYRIRAFAENTYSAYTPEICISLVLNAPSKLSTVSLLPNTVNLVWVDNSRFETGFIIHRKENNGSFEAIDTVAAGIQQYLDTNVKPDTEYTYMVMAYASDICSRFNPEAIWVQKPSSFILVPGGTTKFGEAQALIADFYIDRYELSQAEFQVVMGYNPSQNLKGDNCPVETVTWFEAIEYCNRRSIIEGLIPCYGYGLLGTDPNEWPKNWKKIPQLSFNWQANGYRLPTEAEWQYAASEASGQQSQDLTNLKPPANYDDLDRYAWFARNSNQITHTVGTLKANKLGIYDMLGNVWEWVWDSYTDSILVNPDSLAKQLSYGNKVIRGGSMSASNEKCQVNFRDFMLSENKKRNVGFRICRNW